MSTYEVVSRIRDLSSKIAHERGYFRERDKKVDKKYKAMVRKLREKKGLSNLESPQDSS